MDWEKFVWSRVLLFLAFWSKTFRYEFYTRSGKKNHPIRKSYLINTAFWLVDFWIGVQNWYFKALWPWGLEYWNFHTFIVKLQKKKEKQIIQALVNIFFSSNINITFEEEKKETIIQAHNMLAKSAHCANAMKRLCYIMILYDMGQ